MMRQLHNQHGIDIGVGELGVTVRRGLKWADARPGEPLELLTGPDAATQRHFGWGEVVEVVRCVFRDIPARLIELEHEAASRLYSGLLASMRRAYGGFDEGETVVVLTYRRTS